MTTLIKLTREDILERLEATDRPHQADYLAMYSSWLGGIVIDPGLMLVPVDDHMVHRGDGIFEAFKCLRGSVYLLERHLDRLERSADMIHLQWPLSRPEMKEIILETIRASQASDCLVRLFVSRGPGDFTPSPSSTVGSQLYIIVTRLKHPEASKYENGCRLRTSRVPVKPGFFANVKSCNYLQNVLMKKEAEDHSVDYAVSLDENGCLAEGPTENVCLVSADNELLVPRFDRILRGTTMVRAMELAEELVSSHILAGVRQAWISREDLFEAKEVLMCGTTFDVLPIVEFDGQAIGPGRPGPIYRELLERMRRDQQEGREVLTPVRG